MTRTHSPPASQDVGAGDPFLILGSSGRVDDRTRILKDGDTFAVFDRQGDLHARGRGHHGLFHRGTRHLSELELLIEGQQPLLLSSNVTDDNTLLVVDLANPDLPRANGGLLQANLVHVLRSCVLWHGVCTQRIALRSYALEPLAVQCTLAVAADFRDIFEVRGTARARRGRLLEPLVGDGEVQLRYAGLDGVLRRTRVRVRPAPGHVEGGVLTWDITLQPRAEAVLMIDIACESGDLRRAVAGFEPAVAAAAARVASLRAQAAAFSTSDDVFDHWIERSVADLHMMITDLPEGPYPYAGVPWYSTVFGRDGLITGFECLTVDPSIARGVLAHLAAGQARSADPAADAEPGKILHETREGEMAALGEIPFGRYYGSIDATPLFVMLAGAYWERTGDREFVRALWPHVQAALAWMDGPADLLQDGFVRYQRQSQRGLANQGWKDSGDSVFHADGELAEGPIALCEVQAYAIAAHRAAALMSDSLGEHERASTLLARAESLRLAFETAFWCEDLGTYALALDGHNRACRVVTSNAGHCLFAGAVPRAHAERVAGVLLSDACWSGWGVRTLAATERRYNPMSYHNGSVWPHDNALIAQGLANYGLKQGALQILQALFDAAQWLDLRRLPELVCGFERRPAEGPTLYPVACAPQAWAVAAIFPLLQACLGLSLHAPAREVRIERPVLPEGLQRLTVTGLRLAGGVVDLSFHRRPGRDGVGVDVLRVEGDLRFRITN